MSDRPHSTEGMLMAACLWEACLESRWSSWRWQIALDGDQVPDEGAGARLGR